ncbi:MAG: phosphoesterase PA-phosphatase related [Myxococcaceae bacterium]|nr:phosphoesterase PA-phosphatase related [Myxococcaceae bacterium]
MVASYQQHLCRVEMRTSQMRAGAYRSSVGHPFVYILTVALALASVSSEAFGQGTPVVAPVGPTRTVSVRSDPRSVYRVSLAVDLPVTAASGLAVLIPYALSQRLIRQRCPCDPGEVDRFDRRAIGNTSRAANLLSDVTVGLGIAVPAVLDALALGLSRPLFEDALVFTETLALNGALVTAAKYSVQRPLPRTYAGDRVLTHKPGGYRSFYSGHTSMIFSALSATAMTLRLRYGERYWPWLGTLLIGASVAVERVADGRHFPTDVMLGAAMGTLVGIAVPWLHARPDSFVHGMFATPVAGGASIGWLKAL